MRSAHLPLERQIRVDKCQSVPPRCRPHTLCHPPRSKSIDNSNNRKMSGFAVRAFFSRQLSGDVRRRRMTAGCLGLGMDAPNVRKSIHSKLMAFANVMHSFKRSVCEREIPFRRTRERGNRRTNANRKSLFRRIIQMSSTWAAVVDLSLVGRNRFFIRRFRFSFFRNRFNRFDSNECTVSAEHVLHADCGGRADRIGRDKVLQLRRTI